MLLAHFGERFEPNSEGNARCCDVCDRVGGRSADAVTGRLALEPEAMIQPASRIIQHFLGVGATNLAGGFTCTKHYLGPLETGGEGLSWRWYRGN